MPDPEIAHPDHPHGTVSDPQLPPEEIAALAEAGKAWSRVPPARVQSDAAFIDPDLDVVETKGHRPGQEYVRVVRSKKQGFERIAPGWLQATPRVSSPTTGTARLRQRLRTALLGGPLATRQMAHERLTKLKALAVLSSDALSSVAYATEQILFVLLPAVGATAYTALLPIMACILALLAIVVLSYRQTIKAYPKGGGSYIVASDNLGPIAGLIAGCALMTSYILTVSVSVAAGVDAIVSAAPGAADYRVHLCVAFILLLMLGNLRGIKEAGSIFALPTYAFIVGVFVMIGIAGYKLVTGQPLPPAPVLDHTAGSIPIFILLRAFAQGATALTGVEAISDGVPAFKAPEWRNARFTLTVMGTLLALMFLGITVEAHQLHLTALDTNAANNPCVVGQAGLHCARIAYETIISQLAHFAFGTGALYIYMAVVTTGILVLAGNTAFSDFPRLFYFMARDEYAPHQFGRLGDRLAYSNGILVLGVLSAILVIAFKGDVAALLPLYAIGVFTAFTMSQAGMVARWLRLRQRGWQLGLAMNTLGVATTFLVFTINAIFNFGRGAWIIVVLVPLLVITCIAIHRHYTEVSTHLKTEIPTSPDQVKPVCIVPIAELNGIALQSLALARTISDVVIAVHVCDNEEHIALLRVRWNAWGNHVPLEVVESPYRSFLRPFLAYIDAIDRQRSDDTMVVILPELVATKWWHQLLHNQTALRLKAALLFRPGTVVINVPYHLQRHRRMQRIRRDKDPDKDREAI